MQRLLERGGFGAMAVGLLFMFGNHSVNTAFGISIWPYGLAFVAIGLGSFATYSVLRRRLFTSIAACTLLAVALWMLHEQIAHAHPNGDWRFADGVGIVLAFGALALGAYHERELRAALKELANVQSALSTRYLGQFPHFLSVIVQELSRAEESIVIFCDVPAYGFYSDPKDALAYQYTLALKSAEGKRIELTCLEAETRERYEREQFTEKVWDQWSSDHHAREKVIDFLASRSIDNPEQATWETFIKALDEVHASFLHDVFGRRANEVSLDIPLYFWMIDGRIAVFSIPVLSDKEGWHEYGFITADHALIQAFREMPARYQRKTQEASGVPEARDVGPTVAPPNTMAKRPRAR